MEDSETRGDAGEGREGRDKWVGLEERGKGLEEEEEVRVQTRVVHRVNARRQVLQTIKLTEQHAPE